MENQRAFLDSIGLTIGAKAGDLTPWYGVGQEALLKLGCGPLLSRNYSLSHYKMLRAVYPEHDWLPWKFKKLPALLKHDSEAIERAMRFIETECKINTNEDWYHLSNEQLRDLGVLTLISHLGGLFSALRQYRPDHNWDERRFSGVGSYFDPNTKKKAGNHEMTLKV